MDYEGSIKATNNKFKVNVLNSNSSYGRYLTALVDLAPNEIILEHDPGLIICPKVMGSCSDCLKVTKSACYKCRFFLCDKCLAFSHQRSWHTESECGILQSRSSESPLKGVDLLCLYVIRTWLQMQNTPSTNFLHHLSANIKGLHPRHHVWTSLHKKLLHSYSFPITREKLIQILGIRKVNAKSLAQDRGFGIFSHFSLINHACQSNSIPLIRKEDFALELRAKTFIAKGSEINVTYGQCDVTMGQPLKRETLYRHWDFICTCSSCLTPPVRSLSGVRCNRCYLGISFPIEGHIPGGKWGCDHCGTVYEEGEINILMEDVKLLHHDHYLLSSSCYYSSTKGPTRIQPASLVCM